MVEIRAKKGIRMDTYTTPLPRGRSTKDGYSFHGSTCRRCRDTSAAPGVGKMSPPLPHKTEWSTALCLKSQKFIESRATMRNNYYNYLLCLSNWRVSRGHFCSSVKSQQFYSLLNPHHISLQHSFPLMK